MKKFATLVAGASLLFSTVVFAVDTPTSLAGAEVVDAAKVKSLIASGAKVVDFRAAVEYAEEHIKGAINLPYKEKSAKVFDYDASLDKVDLSKLPADKSEAMIGHCGGFECWKAYKGLDQAVKVGYKKVYWFRGGMPEWKAAGGAVE
jgi:rhodanese-related sulfurtransferase